MKTTTYTFNGMTITVRNYHDINYTVTVNGYSATMSTAKTAYKAALSLYKGFNRNK